MRSIFKVSAVLAAVLLLGGVVFATGTEETAEDEVVLQWWTVESEEFTAAAQTELAQVYSDMTPGVTVEVTILPSSGFGQKMNTALDAGVGGPDVAIFWSTNWFPQALVLDPYIEADNFDTDQYIESFWKTRAMWNDQVIGLPTSLGATLMLYNKDIFDEQGVPYPDADWTTDEFIEIAQSLVDEETRTWGADRPRKPFRTVWHNYGAFPYSDDSTTVDGYLNGPEMVAAYQWFWDLVHSGATPSASELANLGTEGTGPVDLFRAGRIAIATLNQGTPSPCCGRGHERWRAPRASGSRTAAVRECVGHDDLDLEGHRAS